MDAENRNRIESVMRSLADAKGKLIETSGSLAQSSGDWDAAQRLLELAKGLDSTRSALANTIGSREQGNMAAPINAPRVEPVPISFPHYYVEDDLLVKVGKSRNGGVYRHRVTKEHYVAMMAKLAELARLREYFYTQDLVNRDLYANHEPNLVINLLEQKGIVRGVTRGRYAFSRREAIQEQTERVWRELPRY